MNRSERHRYYASREWAILKEQVRERSGGRCERCGNRPYEQTHHLTYERLGNELLEDLQGLCAPCHEYVSGKRHEDPLAEVLTTEIRIDDGVLMCPNCGEGYMHHLVVDVFMRPVEDGDSERTTLMHDVGVVACLPSENPSYRRDGVRIAFSCEFCTYRTTEDGEVDTTIPRRFFVMKIVQHKGNTFMDWDNKAILVPHGDLR